MMRMLFEPTHKVMLTEFFGTLTLADLASLDSYISRFMVGRSHDISGILDFSRVDKIAVTSAQVSGRAQQPQIRRGQRRIFVATSAEAYGLGRMFAAFQAARGNTEPEIVRSLQEAYASLGLVDPCFEAIGEVKGDEVKADELKADEASANDGT
jgi:hypothetical protein